MMHHIITMTMIAIIFTLIRMAFKDGRKGENRKEWGVDLAGSVRTFKAPAEDNTTRNVPTRPIYNNSIASARRRAAVIERVGELVFWSFIGTAIWLAIEVFS